MFQVKICGVTTVDDAILVADAGADAIGLNFYSKSSRYVQPHHAQEITEALVQQSSRQITKVGVFVNSVVEEINEIARIASIDVVQLHGDEPAEVAAALKLPVIRAFRCRSGWEDQLERYLEFAGRLGHQTMAILLDAYKPGEYGGTGLALDWNSMPPNPNLPLILAGGLNPSNVGYAIRSARPAAVDTASGVEISAGVKSPELVNDFVMAANAAFVELPRKK